MKALLLTHGGLEETAAREAKELVGASCRVIESGVIATVKKITDMCELCYRGQSIQKVVLIVGVVPANKELFDAIKKIDAKKLLKWFDEKATFRVTARSVNKKFTRTELEEKIGDVLPLKNNVDLSNPDVEIFVFVDGTHCYLGIDFSGIDLSKREYKIFNTRQSVKGTLAYFLLRFSGYKEKDLLVDPFCDSGEVVIEAALYATGFPVNYYRKDKLSFTRLEGVHFAIKDEQPPKKKGTIFGFSSLLNNVKSAQKNAKIAGVNNVITFSKIDTRYLELKFKKHEVDCIATKLFVSQQNDRKKLLDEFFYQAAFVLKKTGRIAVLTNDEKPFVEPAGKHGFKITKRQTVWAGKRELKALLFKSVLSVYYFPSTKYFYFSYIKPLLLAFW